MKNGKIVTVVGDSGCGKSMVDDCVRASILDYLMKLKEEFHMTIVFITHDIGLAYYVSDRIFIMHKGKNRGAGRSG